MVRVSDPWPREKAEQNSSLGVLNPDPTIFTFVGSDEPSSSQMPQDAIALLPPASLSTASALRHDINSPKEGPDLRCCLLPGRAVMSERMRANI
jgi:hypothetical protein